MTLNEKSSAIIRLCALESKGEYYSFSISDNINDHSIYDYKFDRIVINSKIDCSSMDLFANISKSYYKKYYNELYDFEFKNDNDEITSAATTFSNFLIQKYKDSLEEILSSINYIYSNYTFSFLRDM